MIIIIAWVSLVASGLTFFSGFGLGTVLLPAFAIFFPVEVAVAMTAIVHLLNNLFKLSLVRRHINVPILFRFGVPAILAAAIGSLCLVRLSVITPAWEYKIGSHVCHPTPLKIILAALMLVFALWEVLPKLKKYSLPQRYLPLGGAVSGFFGGLSGQQGALRSVFLLKCGLSKEEFIATGSAAACLVDISRLFIYAGNWTTLSWGVHGAVIGVAVASAFLGAFLGNRFLKKVELETVQRIVAGLLVLVSVLLGTGII